MNSYCAPYLVPASKDTMNFSHFYCSFFQIISFIDFSLWFFLSSLNRVLGPFIWRLHFFFFFSLNQFYRVSKYFLILHYMANLCKRNRKLRKVQKAQLFTKAFKFYLGNAIFNNSSNSCNSAKQDMTSVIQLWRMLCERIKFTADLEICKVF